MLKILKNLRSREWLLILLSILFIVVQVQLDLRLPDYMSEITRLVQTPGSEMNDVLLNGGKMLLCTLGSVASSVVVGYFSANVAARLSRRLRYRLFSKVTDFSYEEINYFSVPSLITRSTNDITQVQSMIAMGLQVVVRAPLIASIAVTKILSKSWQWTAVTGGAIVFLIIVITLLVTLAMPRFKKVQTLTDNLNMVTRENLTGLRVVRAYNAEDFQEKKFKKSNDALTRNYLFATRIMAVMQPSMTIVMSGIPLAIYWVGAHIINSAGMTEKISLFSEMVVFSSYAIQTVMAFMMLAMILVIFPRASVSANRINEVLDTRPRIISGKRQEGQSGIEGEIEFRNVSFKYPDAEEYVLENISFKVNKGETVAFIGSTGSGKSTLINLVPRFYDVSEGEVLVDGINIKEYDLKSLYNKIGYVPQRSVIFSGTIESNINFGENGKAPMTFDDIKNAARIAQAEEFIEGTENKYDSDVSQGGTNLSGGQKQRLAIARAVARKPEIYIFDDTFSALDYKTDKVLRQTLRDETKHVTSLIVAQRIGTIKDADKIVVLDDGKIVGMGKHSELLKTCEVYGEIAQSQLSKEELENA